MQSNTFVWASEATLWER